MKKPTLTPTLGSNAPIIKLDSNMSGAQVVNSG